MRWESESGGEAEEDVAIGVERSKEVVDVMVVGLNADDPYVRRGRH